MPRNALVLLMILAASPAAAEAADAGTNANPAAPGPATPPKPKAHRAIVPDFVLAGAAHPDLGRVLSDAAAQGANDAPDLQVLAQSEIVALLGVERTKVMLGCAEDA